MMNIHISRWQSRMRLLAMDTRVSFGSLEKSYAAEDRFREIGSAEVVKRTLIERTKQSTFLRHAIP